MKENNEGIRNRRSLITGIGAAAAGIAGAAALAQSRGQLEPAAGFRPMRHDSDLWMDEVPGNHRVFVDSASAVGGAQAVGYARNIYAAHQSGYSGTSDDIAMIVCFRHASTPFGFGDAVWKKYGEAFHTIMDLADPDTGRAPTVNLLNASGRRGMPNRGVTIDYHVDRGTQFVICDLAAHGIAQQAAAATGASADDVYAEFVASAIPNSRFVSAGVLAATRAQEFGYSLLYTG